MHEIWNFLKFCLNLIFYSVFLWIHVANYVVKITILISVAELLKLFCIYSQIFLKMSLNFFEDEKIFGGEKNFAKNFWKILKFFKLFSIKDFYFFFAAPLLPLFCALFYF